MKPSHVSKFECLSLVVALDGKGGAVVRALPGLGNSARLPPVLGRRTGGQALGNSALFVRSFMSRKIMRCAEGAIGALCRRISLRLEPS